MSSSNRRQSLNSSRQADINLPSETSARVNASPRNISRTRKSGGLFNIWGTQRGPNLNETHQTDSEDEA
ncbi:hypothetical protein Bca101_004056 [Brassica carinata]